METRNDQPALFSLRDVTVRPVRCVAERRRWDTLVSEHHYLSFSGLFGKALRHVAVVGDLWLALIGWQAGAFKVGVRDRWIGWSREQRFARLHLIANNARFTVLPPGRVPNLASRVLGLSLRRLSRDMEEIHGYPVYVAESFVDRSRFSGACYRASNWRPLGFTRGFSRIPGGPPRWRFNGQPKEVLIFELADDSAAHLCGDTAPGGGRIDETAAPMSAPALHSLHDFFLAIPDFRHARGKRYCLACIITIAVAARLAGYRGVVAFGQYAGLLDQEQLEAVGAFWSPSRQCYTPPAATTFHYILAALPPDALDQAIRGWSTQHTTASAGVALDGKDVRGASRQIEGEQRMMVAAIEHGSGLVLGQVQVPDKTNEIPAVRQLSGALDLAGRTITLDALHAQQETARCLLDECAADYLVTAVKDNQPTMHDDLQAIDWSTARHYESDIEKAHGRVEKRRCWVLDITGPDWDGYCALYGRRQAIRIEREVYTVKSETTTTEITHCLTSLGAERASPEDLLALVRNHWHIENRLHYVRDFTYDEDRCRVRVRNLPRNLACLTNAGISIVRCKGDFKYLPEANRYYAARTQEALDSITNPIR